MNPIRQAVKRKMMFFRDYICFRMSGLSDCSREEIVYKPIRDLLVCHNLGRGILADRPGRLSHGVMRTLREQRYLPDAADKAS